MSRGPDVGTLLWRAIERDADARGCAVRIVTSEATRWASATFSGARHRLTLEGPATTGFAAWVGGLPELDLPLRGHLVADLATIGLVTEADRATVSIEVLTVEA